MSKTSLNLQFKPTVRTKTRIKVTKEKYYKAVRFHGTTKIRVIADMIGVCDSTIDRFLSINQEVKEHTHFILNSRYFSKGHITYLNTLTIVKVRR